VGFAVVGFPVVGLTVGLLVEGLTVVGLRVGEEESPGLDGPMIQDKEQISAQSSRLSGTNVV